MKLRFLIMNCFWLKPLNNLFSINFLEIGHDVHKKRFFFVV
jgi:hypothetical protein